MTADNLRRHRRHSYRDEGEWAAAIADRIGASLRAGLENRERALLVLPGGATPAPVFPHLRAIDLDWSRIDILPGDERWVAPDDAASNEGSIRRQLWRGPAAQARFHGLYRPSPRPSAALPAIERDLGALSWPIAALWLGMGEDGHIASLFPGQDIMGAGRLVASDQAISGWPRLSLGLPVLAAAEATFLSLKGEAKRAILDRAFAGGDLPIARLLREALAPIDIFHLT